MLKELHILSTEYVCVFRIMPKINSSKYLVFIKENHVLLEIVCLLDECHAVKDQGRPI